MFRIKRNLTKVVRKYHEIELSRIRQKAVGYAKGRELFVLGMSTDVDI